MMWNIALGVLLCGSLAAGHSLKLYSKADGAEAGPLLAKAT